MATERTCEATLDEWVGRLPESHRARKRYEAMKDALEAMRQIAPRSDEDLAWAKGCHCGLCGPKIRAQSALATLDATDGD